MNLGEVHWAALALALGCAGAGDASAPSLSLVFTPDPELEAQTQRWAARWSAATGVDISVSEGGTPVRVNDGLHEVTGLCAADAATYKAGERLSDVIEIDRITSSSCSGWGYLIGHEMGHALGGGHSATGIMRKSLPVGHVYVIDAASLEQVCASLACTAFNSEPEGFK